AAAPAARCRKFRRGTFLASLPNAGPRRSFRLYVRRFDDRPPFFDFGVVKGGEPLWGLLLARSNVEAGIGKALAHRQIGEGLSAWPWERRSRTTPTCRGRVRRPHPRSECQPCSRSAAGRDWRSP